MVANRTASQDLQIKYSEEDRGQMANIINRLIEDYYNIRLINCGMCGNILAIPSSQFGDCACTKCGFADDECHFPDLFY